MSGCRSGALSLRPSRAVCRMPGILNYFVISQQAMPSRMLGNAEVFILMPKSLFKPPAFLSDCSRLPGGVQVEIDVWILHLSCEWK